MMTDRSSKVLADYLMCDDKIEDAAKLMRLYASHGYKKITACPLYCSETTVTEFLRIRDQNLKALNKALSGEKIPDIIAGAEVMFDADAFRSDLKQLSLKSRNKINIRIKNRETAKSLFPLLNKLLYGVGLNPVLSQYDCAMLFLSEEDRKMLYEIPRISFLFSAFSLHDYTVRSEIKTIKKHKRSIYFGTYAKDVLAFPPQTELMNWTVDLLWGSEKKYTEYLKICEK